MSWYMILPTLSNTLRQWVMQLHTNFYWYNLLKEVPESAVSLNWRSAYDDQGGEKACLNLQ